MNTFPSQSLPTNPDIAQLRRQAKELLRSARATGDASMTKLADAQRVLARQHGFDSWPRLRAAVATATPAATGPRAARPVFAEKERSPDALFTATRFLDSASEAGWEPGPLPNAIVFTFHPAYTTLLANDPRFEPNTRLAPGNSTMFMTTTGDPCIAVTCLSPGATAMIGQVEHQVALGGADRFVILGSAGSIRSDVAVGTIVVVDSAVRDDGVSSHYLPPDTFVDAHADVVDQLTRSTESLNASTLVGSTWTVPTPYRSTAIEVEQLVAEGVAVVECEVASLLAVAEAIGAQAGALLSVTSSLCGEEAASALHPANPAVLLEAALNALGLNH